MRTILVVVLCLTNLCFGTAAPSIGIWTAAADGNVQVIKQYIEAGTDLNGRESVGGSTPLTVAALLGQTEVARILIDAGAGINERNNDGATALHVAAFFAYPEVVTLLLWESCPERRFVMCCRTIGFTASALVCVCRQKSIRI